MAAGTHAVVFSDIHIGNGAPTCWYQPSVHDEYLTAALRSVAHDERIRDVVFLGDMFDVWTYPPSVQPPTMAEILHKNGTLLGPTGPLAELVKAKPGHVVFMPGNHDGTIGVVEIAQLNTALGGNVARGEAIKLIVDPSLVLRGSADGPRTVVSHGHHWCMFNAPDAKSPWGGSLPVGHLVSRAIAYKWSKKLKPGQTVADLPGMGNPGLDVSRVPVLKLVDLWVGKSDDIVTPMLDYVCDGKVTGLPPAEPIVLPGGKTTTVNDAKHDFGYLFADWESRLGRRDDAKRAAAADLKGNYLAWFAQRLALQTSSDLVVMGHTHEPLAGLRVSPVSYVNSGYECVSKPDLRTNNFTFTLIDLVQATAKVYKVVKRGTGFTIAPANVPWMDSAIQAPAIDYSCYVRITNRTGKPLKLAGTPDGGSAFWAVPPPDTIPVQGRADIWLQDEWMKAGADGDVTYTDDVSAHGLTFEFACPVTTWNRVRSPVHNYETKSGSAPWRAGKTDRMGHPLQVRFIAEPAVLPPAVPGSPQPGVLSANADYFAITRPLLARYDEDRGKVMCHARLMSSDGLPLIDTTTEPGVQPGHIRLKNPPNHLLSPDVYAIDDKTYGLFHYVLISPNGPMAPPVLGGFLFLPQPGLLSLHLVTFNVARLDVSDRTQCGNAHHAEQQVTRWISEQSPRWRNRVQCLTLTNNSRKADFAYSPCNACCHDLANFLDGMNRLRSPSKLAAALSWNDLYNKAAICGHPTDKTGITLLKDSGWKLQGPVPRGVDSADGMTARPGETPCLSPERPAERVLTTA
jgi:UDP-2,3-diacylglucosamine pyrophosphatase LpxH